MLVVGIFDEAGPSGLNRCQIIDALGVARDWIEAGPSALMSRDKPWPAVGRWMKFFTFRI